MTSSLDPPRDPTQPLLVVFFFAMPARLRTDEQPAASALTVRERSSLRASFVLRERENPQSTDEACCTVLSDRSIFRRLALVDGSRPRHTRWYFRLNKHRHSPMAWGSRRLLLGRRALPKACIAVAQIHRSPQTRNKACNIGRSLSYHAQTMFLSPLQHNNHVFRLHVLSHTQHAHVRSDAMTTVSCFSHTVRFHTSSPASRPCATSLLGRTAGRADCGVGGLDTRERGLRSNGQGRRKAGCQRRAPRPIHG